jgi:hypothetical protein
MAIGSLLDAEFMPVLKVPGKQKDKAALMPQFKVNLAELTISWRGRTAWFARAVLSAL